MSSSNVRIQRVMAVLVAMVMLLSLVNPTASADAKGSSAPAGKRSLPQGKPVSSLGMSVPARELAQRFSAPITDGDAPVDDSVVITNEKRGGFPIPRGTSGAGLAPAADSSRPVSPPDKRIHDDPVPGLDAGWEGISQGVNRIIMGFGVLPPDTNGDASYCQYVQVVNSAMAVWDLCDISIYGTYPKNIMPGTATNLLFTGTGGMCEYTNDGDPIVMYDEPADRWIILQFALTVDGFDLIAPSALCIAVSTSGDATGSYYLYEIGGISNLPDYPHLGIMDDTYTVSVNEFTLPAFGWDGQGAYFFDRDAFLDGTGGVYFYFHAFDWCTGTEVECTLGGMLPAGQDIVAAPAGEVSRLVAFDDDYWGYSGDQLRIFAFDVDWVAVTAYFWHEVDLPVSAFASDVCNFYGRNCIDQPNTTSGLDAIADRLMYRVQYINFGTHETMVLNHTIDMSSDSAENGTGQAGIRWYELQDSGSGWSVVQEGEHAPDSDNRWMGSIAMDAMGNMALGYSVSGAVTAPKIRYAGRVATDPLGTLPLTELDLVPASSAAGSQTSTSYRWGDYSSMSVDITGCEFYYTQEYYRAISSAEWTTRVGAFNMPDCYADTAIEPETYFDATPPDPSYSHDADFDFYGTPNGGTPVFGLECSLDAGAWYDCSGSYMLDELWGSDSFTGLAAGSHTFEVRAINMLGVADSTPASYTWNIALVMSTFRSVGTFDGQITESSEFSNAGGVVNSTATTLSVGDATADKQIRSVLSFDTAGLPNTAVVTAAWVQVKRSTFTGTNPFGTHGGLYLDIRNPFFGTGVGLVASDFQAANSDSNVAGPFSGPVSFWYTGTLTSGLSFVNLLGPTQFRLSFPTLDDNDDGGADTVNFFSGNSVLANRPMLIIEYYVP